MVWSSAVPMKGKRCSLIKFSVYQPFKNMAVIKMRENLLLFNDELDRLKETGWDYEIVYQDEKKRIYVVKAEVPEKVWRHLHNQK